MTARNDPYANLPQRINRTRRFVYALAIVTVVMIAITQWKSLPGHLAYFAVWLSFLLFLYLVCMALHLRDLRRRKRHLAAAANRTCVQCHYDLTGNVSGVCPECGHHLSSLR